MYVYVFYFMGECDLWFDVMCVCFWLEDGLLFGGGVALVGLLIAAVIVIKWIECGFGELFE